MSEKESTGYPSIDKPWLKYYKENVEDIEIPRETIWKHIYTNNLEHLDETALIFYGKKITWKELFKNVRKVSEILAAEGVKKNDYILVCMTGTPETLYLILACSKIGACAVMLNPTLKKEQLLEIIRSTKTNFIFCMDKLYDAIAEAVRESQVEKIVIIPAIYALPKIVKLLITLKESDSKCLKEALKHGAIMWNTFLRGQRVEAEENEDENLPLAVVFTSGTTGKAKGIVHSNRSYVALSTEYANNGYPFKRGDKFLAIIPTFIAAGLSYMLLAPLAQGIVMVLEPQYSEKSFIADTLKYKPNILGATKSFWYAALHDSKMQKETLSYLKIPITGGEAMFECDTININRFLKEHGCKKALYVGYGMSELNATATTTAEQGSSNGSSGIPLPHITVAAFSVDSGLECTYEEYGELQVLSPCGMLEYFQNPEETEKFFKKDAAGNMWCHTGDIGYVNKQGEVFVLGRATDCFMTNEGKRIYLFDIENAILKNKKVVQCKVIDMEYNGRIVLAAHIVLATGEENNVDEIMEEIHSYCKTTLDADMVPLLYKFRDSFPLTPNGKRDIKKLKQETEGFEKVTGNI